MLYRTTDFRDLMRSKSMHHNHSVTLPPNLSLNKKMSHFLRVVILTQMPYQIHFEYRPTHNIPLYPPCKPPKTRNPSPKHRCPTSCAWWVALAYIDGKTNPNYSALPSLLCRLLSNHGSLWWDRCAPKENNALKTNWIWCYLRNIKPFMRWLFCNTTLSFPHFS